MGWGDDLMVLGEAQTMSAEHGGKPIAIIDGSGNLISSKLFLGQKCVANRIQPGDPKLEMGPGGRPYIAGSKLNARVWKRYKPKPAKLVFTDEELAFIDSLPSGYVVVEPHVKKGAGKVNKDWGFERYQKVLQKLQHIQWVQMGSGGLAKLEGATYIPTKDFRSACAVLSKASGYLGPEGGLHHASAALGVPAVVIFGGYISPEVTGYNIHTNLFTGQGLGCGTHTKCKCDCLDRITVDQVAEAVVSMTRQQGPEVPHREHQDE